MVGDGFVAVGVVGGLGIAAFWLFEWEKVRDEGACQGCAGQAWMEAKDADLVAIIGFR